MSGCQCSAGMPASMGAGGAPGGGAGGGRCARIDGVAASAHKMTNKVNALPPERFTLRTQALSETVWQDWSIEAFDSDGDHGEFSSRQPSTPQRPLRVFAESAVKTRPFRDWLTQSDRPCRQFNRQVMQDQCRSSPWRPGIKTLSRAMPIPNPATAGQPPNFHASLAPAEPRDPPINILHMNSVFSLARASGRKA